MKAGLLTLMIASLSSVALVPAGAAHAAKAKPINATYTCDKGQTLQVVFQGDRAVVTTKNSKAITLTQAMTADGFLYRDAKHSLRGRGDDATWTSGDYKPLHCTAR